MGKIRYTNFFLALLVNSFLILFDSIFDERNVNHAFRSLGNSNFIEVVLFILGCVMILTYITSFVFWIILQFPLDKNNIVLSEEEILKEEQVDRLKEEYYDVENLKDKHGKKLTIQQKREARKKREQKLKDEITIGYPKLIWRVLSETYFLFSLCLILFAILGLTWSKLFFSFLLFDIITLSPLMKNVIRAFTMNIRSLIVTMIFGLILIFIYTSVTYFSILRAQLQFIDDENLEMCFNFLHCYIMHINFGMRSGGGFGEALLYPSYTGNKNIYIFRTIFDMIFFITIIVIILEIIFGLIVDSFGELREIRNNKRKSKQP
jgi:uncharacterized membrane protein